VAAQALLLHLLLHPQAMHHAWHLGQARHSQLRNSRKSQVHDH
jgi:hypothetical protein